MPKQKAAEALFEQLSKTLETDGEDLVSKLKVQDRAFTASVLALHAYSLHTHSVQVKQSAYSSSMLRTLGRVSVRLTHSVQISMLFLQRFAA